MQAIVIATAAAALRAITKRFAPSSSVSASGIAISSLRQATTPHRPTTLMSTASDENSCGLNILDIKGSAAMVIIRPRECQQTIL